jgi:hypothetical protein
MDSETASLRVETGTYDEAADLLRALSLRGVSGRVAVEVAVEIDQLGDGASPLETVVALAGWLQERDSTSIQVRLDGRRYDVRAGAPRAGSDMAAARPTVES